MSLLVVYVALMITRDAVAYVIGLVTSEAYRPRACPLS
jgi:hypothetical protein